MQPGIFSAISVCKDSLVPDTTGLNSKNAIENNSMISKAVILWKVIFSKQCFNIAVHG